MADKASREVHEEHPEVFHYTTAAGLWGIIESQAIWATNINYMNDAEEHIGFFDRRLPTVLKAPVGKAVEKLLKTPTGRKFIEKEGGQKKVVDEFVRSLTVSMRDTVLGFNNPYVTSFCSTNSKAAERDGLLSQWRGYGTDGGYAIVFDSKNLYDLLKVEETQFDYQYMSWGDVDYFDHETQESQPNPVTEGWITAIQNAVEKFIVIQRKESFDDTHTALASLSCFQKHRGFQEEAEIRIVAMPSNKQLRELARAGGVVRPEKPISFITRRGLMVPYIALLGKKTIGGDKKLPIKRIIVGPHQDRDKRKASVELLLGQADINAGVLVSEIPYVGG